jgi:protein TonB
LAGATAPRFDADYLDNPAPAYPPLSRRQHEEGKVVLQVYVEASGLAGKVELHTSSGYERLDRSAIAAVSRWKFAPARQGAAAVGAWVLVPLVFSLKG